MEAFIPDIPRAYTALAEWLACVVCVSMLEKRFRPAWEYAAAVLLLGAFYGLHRAAGALPVVFWIPGMAAAVLLMLAAVLLLAKVNFVQAVYFTGRAFIIAEFAASLEWQFHHYITDSAGFRADAAFDLIFLFFVYALVFFPIFVLERRYRGANLRLKATAIDMLVSAEIALIIFFIGNVSFISRNTPISGSFAGDVYYIRTLVNLCGVILLYALQEQRLLLHAKLGIAEMQKLLDRQYEQYRMSKEAVESVNRKYHDIKHQIAAVRAERNAQKREGYLEELEAGIKNIYTQYSTGNGVLDIILTNKTAYCVERGINFTCVADGSRLGFLEIADLCSLAGNAIDNAVEYAEKLEDPEKRLVKAAVYGKEGILMFRFENYIEEAPQFSDGFPVSTKADRKNHGYGIKSIKAVADKYGGAMNIEIKGNWFILSVMIPLDNTGKK